MNTSKPILILFATQSGVTEEVSKKLHSNLHNEFPKLEFRLKNIVAIKPPDLQNYSAVLFGASSWDDGVNIDTQNFLEMLGKAKPNLASLPCALFGLGDSLFLEYCPAQKIIKFHLEKYNAAVYSDIHTIDGYPTEAQQAELADWAAQFIKNLKNA